MSRQAFKVAAATGQIALGLPAVVGFASAIVYLIGSGDVDSNRAWLAGITLVLGGSLLAIWLAARTKRGPLIALIICSGVLFAVTTMIATVAYRPTRFDALRGLWSAPAVAGIDVLLWLVIMVLAIVELRLRRTDLAAIPRWVYLPSIVAPLALITALVIMVGTAMPGWLIRLNSTVEDGAQSQPGQGSALSGGIRWTHDIDGDEAVATAYGVAVAVAADGHHSGGVVMIDAGTGRQLWRYQLHGTVDAPEIASTDDGHGIVLDLRHEGELPSQIPPSTYVIDAATGQVRGIWPNVGEVAGTEPPVIFDHVAQGANSVIAVSPAGHKLWTYRPESCADPRSVSSTPEVMVVIARRCGGDYRQRNVVGLDAKTGDPLWTQPAATGSSESGPDETLARPGFRIEVTRNDSEAGHAATAVARRDLRTGRMDWVTSVGQACNGSALTAGGETAYLSICQQDNTSKGSQASPDNEPNVIVGHSMRTGDRVLSHKLDGQLQALAGVDDHTALAVVGRGQTCRLERIGDPSEQHRGTNTLLTVPSATTNSGGKVARCDDLALLRVGRNWILQFQIRDADGSIDSSYRFTGLN